jgi:DNA-binding Lrp family transcriptional regulator
MTELSKTNLAILRLLQGDARLTNEEVGNQVGRDSSVVSRRVTELEKAKVIVGYHAVIAPEKIGLLTTIYKLVQLVDHRPEVTDAFEREIDAMPNVVEWAQIEGSWDYLVKFLVEDTPQHDRLHLALRALPVVKLVRGMRVQGKTRMKPIPIPTEAITVA